MDNEKYKLNIRDKEVDLFSKFLWYWDLKESSIWLIWNEEWLKDENENLLDKYSANTTKDNFLNALDSFIKSGDQAIELESKKDACAKWQKHLGDRFPCSTIEEKDEDVAKAFSSPDQLRYDNKSA